MNISGWRPTPLHGLHYVLAFGGRVVVWIATTLLRMAAEFFIVSEHAIVRVRDGAWYQRALRARQSHEEGC